MSTPKPMVYVAGPITGDPFGCVRQAAEAFDRLRHAGCVPFLPQLSVIHEMVSPRPYETWMAHDFDVIAKCDALVRLPGASPGADREVAFARSLTMPVFVFHESVDDALCWALVADWAAGWRP